MGDEVAYVVVFVPALNEEGTIGKLIKRINELYRNRRDKGFTIEVIVVNDGSTDKTEEIAKEAGAVKIVKHPFSRGLGAATRTGMQTAYEMKADIAVKIDADFQHDPQDIEKVIRPILDDEADCVFGSRFLGGLQYKMPFHRKWGNTFFSFLVRKLTGLNTTDAQTGLMAFSRRYLRKFEMVGDYNETQQLIIDSWGKHFRVIEVPVVFHKRMRGKSFISPRYPFRVLPVVLRMIVRTNPLRVFVPAGCVLISVGVIVALAVIFGWAPPFVGDATVVVLLVGGIQIVMFGLLADIWAKRR